MNQNKFKGMKAVALGTGGGPIVSGTRAGTSTAICVDDAVYLVDCGMGSIRNYRNHLGWGSLRSIFITHHHSDHIYDLGSYLLTGWQVPGESFSRQIQVFGPDKPPRAPALDEQHYVEVACCTAGHAMVGTKEMVDALLSKVFASDIVIRMIDERRSSPFEWVQGHDIKVPEEAGADPVNNRHPEMEPFLIYEDEKVKVSTILVDHRLCYPAFGYRFESEYGVIVVSGDTAYSENCIKLAKDADILFHEVIDLEAILKTFPEGPTRDGIAVHLEESHTSYENVGKVASEASVGVLVLHHIVPNTPGSADVEKMVRYAKKDFAGPVTAAEDNDCFFIAEGANKIKEFPVNG
ncbi:MBL fold metallo-hydrolase [Marinobacterium aestuariivivens]|uniref:MBL fold metallo-hydrolase n=1 Tax=Marinobacterium aestuariivivens TaxID=1698799 RepID=A0ABW2A9Q7_9GAMM